jgi:ribosome-associated heat shock protein Hsp15
LRDDFDTHADRIAHADEGPGAARRSCDPCSTSHAGQRSMMDVMESTRVDRWLWAVRLTKTRPDAAAACRGGHVRVNDRPAKPATTVSPGDEVRARLGDTTRIVEVVRVIQKRVGAADAVTCYCDRSPAPAAFIEVLVAARDRGTGRPTKRDRRILDKWRARRR